MKTFWLMLALAALSLTGSGCASLYAGDENESPQPWAQPQPWEGAPGIPGMETR